MNTNKRAIVELLLPQSPFLLIVLETPGLHVGFLSDYGRDGNLILQIGNDPRAMCVPDFAIDDKGWSGVLTSKGHRTNVEVPWEAVGRLAIHAPGADMPSLVVEWPHTVHRIGLEAPLPQKRDHLKLV